MDEHTQNTSPDPTVLTAHLNEANDLIAGLRNRCGTLHAEIVLRDQRIAELEAELQAAAATTGESGDDRG